MEDFSLSEMQAMQQRLLEQYKDWWEPLAPEAAKNKLLWLTSELGEVIDIVKNRVLPRPIGILPPVPTWWKKWQMC